MIKSNHNFLKHDQENALEFKFYTLVALIIMIKLIITSISLLMTQNLILIDCTSVQKTSWIFNQDKFRTEVYYTSN